MIKYEERNKQNVDQRQKWERILNTISRSSLDNNLKYEKQLKKKEETTRSRKTKEE